MKPLQMRTIRNSILAKRGPQGKDKLKNTDSRPEPPLTDPRSFEAQAIDSSRLFGGRTEVEIRHNGRTYRLRRTRLGKLILTA